MTIDAWLRNVSSEFADAMIPSARLDAEIILAHTINRPRTWLHAHGSEALDPRRRDIADARAELRLERVPIAYIIGHKYFYGRRFIVTPDVLIPRPESEALIELLADQQPAQAARLVDVGTGSGCLGITAKLEHPELDVTLLDTSKAALAVAQKNCDALGATTINLMKSNLLQSYPYRADVIIANLPYVGRDWNVSSDTVHEPEQALYADDDGLAVIKKLLASAASSLQANGVCIIEADERQHTAIIEYAMSSHLHHERTHGLGLLFRAS
ncbi:protein-(glutamine-N5) methyltransferase, release factor-specific [Candidatus Saccharibacteria bacterium]|nr:MAG: protein-(glutamine-N5) methyltransferase, release factor-specific [Candidatus Saccharibacteria bacterium]